MAHVELVTPLSVLEVYILDTLRHCNAKQATIAELAQRIALPEEAIRIRIQRLVANKRVQWDADHAQYRIP